MNNDQIELLLNLQLRQTEALEKIAQCLERLTPQTAPDYQSPLENFKTFDWSSINAEVVRVDQFGAAIVSWGGKEFIRRSPSNQFGAAIWFSRCIGKENDRNIYEKLITFKPTQSRTVEPVSEKARNYF